MMFRKKIAAGSAFTLILTAIVLSGCAGQSASGTAKNDFVSKPPTALNNNNVSPTSPANTQASIGNNASLPKDKKPSPAVKQPTPQIGTGGDDLSLFTQARGALSSDKELLNAVIIEIKEGNAILSGSVSSEAQKTKAAQLVQGVKGIKSVKNNLRAAS
ncbi:MAG TPA: BON domain-containing protein [Pyrinomonadaceae bacterium]|jgi:hypothetical protein